MLTIMYSYEEERLPRVKAVHVKGIEAASSADKEKYLYKPSFKPLWHKQVGPLSVVYHEKLECTIGFFLSNVPPQGLG